MHRRFRHIHILCSPLSIKHPPYLLDGQEAAQPLIFWRRDVALESTYSIIVNGELMVQAKAVVQHCLCDGVRYCISWMLAGRIGGAIAP